MLDIFSIPITLILFIAQEIYFHNSTFNLRNLNLNSISRYERIWVVNDKIKFKYKLICRCRSPNNLTLLETSIDYTNLESQHFKTSFRKSFGKYNCKLIFRTIMNQIDQTILFCFSNKMIFDLLILDFPMINWILWDSYNRLVVTHNFSSFSLLSQIFQDFS